MEETHEIDDKNKALLYCLKDIRLRLRNMGTVVESNEAIRCEYFNPPRMYSYYQRAYWKKKSLNRSSKLLVKKVQVAWIMKNALEELICIAEGKQHQIAIGFVQVSMIILL